ncbi:MAG TPA: acylneuraminate cytidylyltransferase family protein [Acidobacteriota bacterium]|nr:acylneuraminate cytidylyltransferase family protein [Acidobacteriota bacterium]
MTTEPNVVALIPARAGSKRIVNKNIRPLAGHPLIAYTIVPALESDLFDTVIVSTDSEEIAAIARHYGAEVPVPRPAEFAADQSPDIEWLEHALERLGAEGRAWDCFALLRPTSPFRSVATLRRAWAEFLAEGDEVDSLRAVEKTKLHPGKMWLAQGRRIVPAVTQLGDERSQTEQPWHSTPYQALPPVYSQNASLEIGWSRIVLETRTIAGTTIMPFFTEGEEGFDINDEIDWSVAEELVRRGAAELPRVSQAPWNG